MRCKNVMLFVLACILPLFAKATGSSADAVYIDGEEWSLLAKPLEADSAISARLYAFLPENRKWTTANYGGYDAVWEMVGDSLYLKRVSVSLYDENTGKYTEKNFKADTLHCIFDGKVFSNGIFAYWVNGKIRAGRGKTVRYFHDAFFRNLEQEKVMDFDNGVAVGSQTFNNHRTAGLRSEIDIAGILSARFPWDEFPEIKAGGRISFHLKDVAMTADGRFVDCLLEVFYNDCDGTRVNITDQNSSCVKAMKELLAFVYPWEVYEIYGERIAVLEGWIVSLRYPDDIRDRLGVTK